MQARSYRVRRTTTKVTTGFAMTMVLVALSVVGQAATASPGSPSASIESQRPLGFTQGALAGIQAGVHPHICNPQPPDYPGCTAEQLYPVNAQQVHDRYHHNWFNVAGRGNIWSTVTQAQRDKMKRLWNEAYARANQGTGESATSDWHFRYFAGFAPKTVSTCNVWAILGMPYQYCPTPTGPHSLGDLIDSTTRLVMHCNAAMVTGVVTGAAGGAIAGWMSLGGTVLGGGMVGGVLGELGCQTNNLWEWGAPSWLK